MRLFAGLTSALLCALFAGAGFASADPAVTISNDGTYTVGKDITPGVYESAGPLPGAVCYWRRAGADNATLNNAMSKQPQIVQIEATDATFKTKGCQPWQLTDAPPPGLTPPWLSGLQLRHDFDVLNGLAGQSGNGQPPPG
ncbi:MAG TPA: hypothetical protein PLH92_13880 [Mycobacterium sp.]|nr:hypothetical protein [Mycobacterium sp.]HQC77795.1 hypothetical protein [Mycobacterium sp.]